MTTTTITTRQTALDAYVDACDAIRAHLDTLTAAVDERHGVGPDDIQWGHVGDMNSLQARLAELVAQHA